jgi:hypothetical protein
MLEILSVGYFVGIVLAVAGGITFGLWPKPSLVETLRVVGVAFAVVSVLLTGSFVIYLRHTQDVHLALWFWWVIAFVPPLGMWLFSAMFTDRLTGGHFFGRPKDEYLVVENEVKHIDIRV